MKKVIYLIFCAFLSAHCVNAQNVMRIHFNNNTSQDFDVNTIDSVCWIIPDVPDDGGQEVQYTTIYWGWTDATHMFKDAQNSIDPTIYPELTLLDPTTVDFKVSGNGVTANTVNVSGNRWQSPIVDVDSRRTLYVAVPTGWGIERWEETYMHSLQLYIQWIDREDGYTLYYNYFPSLEYNDQMFIIKKGLPKGYDVE